MRHGYVVSRPIAAGPYRGTLNSASKPIGIVPKVREQQTTMNSDYWEIDSAENTLDIEVIVPIYIRSLQKYQLMKAASEMGLSRLAEVIIFQPSTATLSNLTMKERLLEYGLTISPASRDGNCFFTAIALSMMADYQRWKH